MRNHAPMLWVVGLLVLAVGLIWYEVFAEERSTEGFVAFLNVGQGDALFIESAEGRQVLIDGGSDGAVLRELGKFMRANDRTIDVVIATHPDLDHIGGLPDVFERYRVGLYLEPGILDEGSDNQAVHRAVAAQGTRLLTARSGMSLALGAHARLDILFPDRDVSGMDPNAGSIVARLTCADRSYLFMADAPRSIEGYLTSLYGVQLKSTVLKVGHHGSHTSTSEELLDVVAPETAVISAGCDNRYGHPHQSVLDSLFNRSIEVRSTCTDGTVVFACR